MPSLESERQPHICIAHPGGDSAYSETFIREHISRIPEVKTVLSKGVFPSKINGVDLFSVAIRQTNKIMAALPFSISRDLAFLQRNRLLARVLRRRHVDIVLAEYGPTGSSITPACRIAGVPLVVHFHGQDAFHVPTLEKYRSGYRAMFKSVAGIIVGTDEMRQQVEALGAPADKIYKNPCGVDTQLFQPIDAAQNPPVFLALGRFVEKKAPHLTILAFHKVVQSRPDAKLIMIGDGNLLDACKQIVRALCLVDHVEFRGALNQQQVAELMKTARAFVQHSAKPESGDSEGTSISVLEAASTALPVVATRHGGIKDSVKHGLTGFLVDEYDIESMTHYMLKLVDEPALAGDMGRRGRKRMETKYAMERSISELRSILLRVLETSPRAVA